MSQFDCFEEALAQANYDDHFTVPVVGIFAGGGQADGDAGGGAFNPVYFPKIVEGGGFLEAVDFETEGRSNFIVLILAGKKVVEILLVLIHAE